MTSAPRLSLIFAMSRNRALGFRGDLPWHISEDLKRFKALTLGHPCLMGRRTFESIVDRLGKPLPGRTTLVISRRGFDYPDIPVFPDVEEAIEAARLIAIRDEQDDAFVCGGAEIYQATLPFADRLYVTEVDMIAQADVYMPEWSAQDFREVSREAHPATDTTPGFSFITLDRVQ